MLSSRRSCHFFPFLSRIRKDSNKRKLNEIKLNELNRIKNFERDPGDQIKANQIKPNRIENFGRSQRHVTIDNSIFILRLEIELLRKPETNTALRGKRKKDRDEPNCARIAQSILKSSRRDRYRENLESSALSINLSH